MLRPRDRRHLCQSSSRSRVEARSGLSVVLITFRATQNAGANATAEEHESGLLVEKARDDSDSIM